MISLIFFMSAVGNKIPNFDDTATKMTDAGIPAPQVALVGAIIFLIAGSLCVIVGYKTRAGATLLLVFLALATYYFHPFWIMTDESQKQLQMIAFMKNLSMAGAIFGLRFPPREW